MPLLSLDSLAMMVLEGKQNSSNYIETLTLHIFYPRTTDSNVDKVIFSKIMPPLPHTSIPLKSQGRSSRKGISKF